MYGQLADSQLIELIAQGDSDAFAALYARYSRRIAGFIFRRLSLNDQRKDIVEDLTQETFLRVFTLAPRYKCEYKAPWWVYQQAKRVIQDLIEKKMSMKRQAPTYSLSGLSSSKDGDSSKADRLISIQDQRPRPDEQLLWDERRRALADAVAALPEKYQEAIVLNLREWKHARIAKEIKVTPKEATARISYGRQMIRQRLQAEPTS